MFDKNTYTDRRNKLKSNGLKGIGLILGNGESPMNCLDNTYHFRQDSNFLYFFGLDHPDLAGVIDVDADIDYIYGNDVDLDDIIWMGEQSEPPSFPASRLHPPARMQGRAVRTFCIPASTDGSLASVYPPYVCAGTP